MTAYDAYRTAQFLAAEGRTDTDAVTRTDIDQAADLAGAGRPETATDRHTVLLALGTLAPAAARSQDRGL
ncbi:hypothetical protein OH809_45400 (plasmid) [Streptomyces sp. NBC_00873]|uniref:hypothetical protein n=1 Tax=Streptomyces sp. NBC_00873 TaxID=2975852 RepID=UPI00386D41E6|nr:hypothetical protein OH809_45400 [Streptomyces sp. NBC_00873]